MSPNWRNTSRTDREMVENIFELYPFGAPQLILENSAGKPHSIFYVKSAEGEFVLRKPYIPVPGSLNPRSHAAHLHFEAELLEYLVGNDFKFSPHAFLNKNGSYVTTMGQDIFILVSFLSGNREGNWNDFSKMNVARWRNAFEVLGEFSRIVQDFHPQNIPQEPTLWDIMEKSGDWTDKIEQELMGPTREVFVGSTDSLKSFAEKTLQMFETVNYNKLPQRVVIFDYHIGNLLFNGDEVTGIVDFDWTRMDNRLSDLASGIGLACEYAGPKSGLLDPSRLTLIIEGHNKGFGKSEYDYATEIHILEAATRAYLLFQCLYTFQYHCSKGGGKLDDAHYVLNTVFKNDFGTLFKNIGLTK